MGIDLGNGFSYMTPNAKTTKEKTDNWEQIN